jgi:hypothetical protein
VGAFFIVAGRVFVVTGGRSWQELFTAQKRGTALEYRNHVTNTKVARLK